MRPYLRVANVFEDRIDLTDLKEMDFSGVFERYKLRPGDVLLNEGQSPELLGRPAIYHGTPSDVAFTNTLIRFRPGPDVTPEWALTVFRHYMHSGRFARESRITTNIAHLSATRFKTIEFPVPPLDVQSRIVDILEDHLSRLDVTNSILRANLSRCNHFRLSLIDWAFWNLPLDSDEKFAARLASTRRDLARDPGQASKASPPDEELLPPDRPWPIASLAQVTDPERPVRYGILKPRVADGTIPYVEVKDLAGERLAPSRLRKTSVELDNKFSGARLRSGDVVIAVRGSFERSAVVPPELAGANISRDVVRLAPLPEINPWFLHYWHQSSTSKRYLRRHARGVAVRGVNVGSLRSMPIPVVAPQIQATIVSWIGDRLDVTRRIENELHNGETRIIQLRRALLAAAFSGRLTGKSSDLDRVRELAGV